MRLVDCFGLMGPSILTSTYQQDETFEEKSEAQLKQYHHYKLIDNWWNFPEVTVGKYLLLRWTVC